MEVKQDRAFYDPYRDRIVLPPRDYFKNQESFLSVVLHEMAHSTGHETRFNRSMMGAFGTMAYAREELNAELSSAFIQSDLGISLDGELMEDHARYLASWIQILKEDPNALFQAVGQADRISEYLVKNYEQICSREQVQNMESSKDIDIELESDPIADEAAEYDLTPTEFGKKMQRVRPILEPKEHHYDTAGLIKNLAATLDANAEMDFDLEME